MKCFKCIFFWIVIIVIAWIICHVLSVDNIIGTIAGVVSAIAAVMTLKIAIQAMDDWKKQVDYENITSVKKELIKTIVDYFYTLNLHAEYQAESDIKSEIGETTFSYKTEADRIDYELAKKYRDMEKNINVYLFFRKQDDDLFKDVKTDFKNYDSTVRKIIKTRVDYYNKTIDYEKYLAEMQTYQKNVQSQKTTCKKELDKIDRIFKE